MLQEEIYWQKIMINKSRGDEEANGKDTSEIRSEKKEEIIKSIGHCRPHVREEKSQTKELIAQATQQKFKSQLSENHLD